MHLRPSSPIRLVTLLSAALAGVQASVAADSQADQAVVMDPFNVSSAGDVGYLAKSSLAGSRLNTNLDDIAVPTTVFTQEFLQDTAVRNIDELSYYMPDTEIIYPNANQAFFTNDSVELRIRGLPALNYSVNYFPTSLRLDVYNTDRVDQSRGANSILFGQGSPGGIVNISTNRAVVDRAFGSLTVQPRSSNGIRGLIDVNAPLLHDHLALRLDAVDDDGGTWRYHEYDHQKRAYLAARWRPDDRTTVDVEIEHGTVNKSIGSPSTAADAYTIWKADGSHLSATANAAFGIKSLGAADHLALNTGTDQIMDYKNTMTSVANTIGGTQAYLTDFTIIPKKASLAAGPEFPQKTNYSRGDVFVTHSFSPDLNVELAADGHTAPRDAINGASFDQLNVDPNPTLPNGQPNPNAGVPYVEGFPVRTMVTDKSESLRFTASYQHDFGGFIGQQALGGLYERDWTWQGLIQTRPFDVQNPYSFASPENAANLIYYRTYLNLNGKPSNLVSGDWSAVPLSSYTESVSGKQIGATWLNYAPASSDNRFMLDSVMAVWQSHFWQDRLSMVAGIRQNHQDSWYSPTGLRGPATGNFVLGPFVVLPGTVMTPDSARNETYGAVLRVTRWLGLTYDWESNFSLPSNTAALPTASGRASNPLGRSQDVGLKFDLGHRLSLNATYFKTSDVDDYTAASGLPEATLINEIWTGLAAAGVSAPGGGSALAQQVTINGYNYDAVTTGYELELEANPTPNWRIFLAGSDSKTVQSHIGTDSIGYVNQNQAYWLQGTNGRVLLDGSGKLAAVAVNPANVNPTTVAEALNTMQTAFYNTYTLAENQRPLGNSPLKFSMRTNYAFTEGWLRGFSVGGGVRYKGGDVVAFTQSSPNSAATVLYGPLTILVDANIGYEHPARWLGAHGRWSVQLNVNNLLDQTSIVPLTESATGQVISYRFQPPQAFILTTKLQF